MTTRIRTISSQASDTKSLRAAAEQNMKEMIMHDLLRTCSTAQDFSDGYTSFLGEIPETPNVSDFFNELISSKSAAWVEEFLLRQPILFQTVQYGTANDIFNLFKSVHTLMQKDGRRLAASTFLNAFFMQHSKDVADMILGDQEMPGCKIFSQSTEDGDRWQAFLNGLLLFIPKLYEIHNSEKQASNLLIKLFHTDVYIPTKLIRQVQTKKFNSYFWALTHAGAPKKGLRDLEARAIHAALYLPAVGRCPNAGPVHSFFKMIGINRRVDCPRFTALFEKIAEERKRKQNGS